MTISTYNALRLGDNLHTLHFLRKLAQAHPTATFAHAAQEWYLPQLREVVADVPNLVLGALPKVEGAWWEARPLHNGSINTWKNAHGFWEKHRLKNDYAPFMVDFFEYLSHAMGGFVNPIRTPADLLFDYPALKADSDTTFDVLFINSQPMSGQWRGFDKQGMDLLASDLASKNIVVTTEPVHGTGILCTQQGMLTVTGIGKLSQRCKAIVMVSTGPSWPCFNVWNQNTPRFILIDSERIGLGERDVQARTIEEAREALTKAGLL